MSARFSLGIDLGTTNSAVAIEDFESSRAAIVDITNCLVPIRSVRSLRFLPRYIYRIRRNFPSKRCDCHGQKPALIRSSATSPASMARLSRIA